MKEKFTGYFTDIYGVRSRYRIVLGDGIQREIRSAFCRPRAHGETTTNRGFSGLIIQLSTDEGKYACKTRTGQEIVWSSINQRPPPLVSFLQII